MRLSLVLLPITDRDMYSLREFLICSVVLSRSLRGGYHGHRIIEMITWINPINPWDTNSVPS